MSDTAKACPKCGWVPVVQSVAAAVKKPKPPIILYGALVAGAGMVLWFGHVAGPGGASVGIVLTLVGAAMFVGGIASGK
jgi:predicted phage tail protein